MPKNGKKRRKYHRKYKSSKGKSLKFGGSQNPSSRKMSRYYDSCFSIGSIQEKPSGLADSIILSPLKLFPENGLPSKKIQKNPTSWKRAKKIKLKKPILIPSSKKKKLDLSIEFKKFLEAKSIVGSFRSKLGKRRS